MKTATAGILLVLGLFVSACASVGTPTRNSAFERIPDTDDVTVLTAESVESQQQGGQAAQVVSPAILTSIEAGESLVTVNSIVVRVPRNLKVSEANRYLPRGDIVWREDPAGDRHAQVKKIFQDAMETGVAPLDGPAIVDVDIEVIRFHALTEKARYTTGGVHSITFDLAVKDPKTGVLLMPIRTIRADLDGFGGKQALEAEARGETQKVRISEHLATVIRQELSNPEGYENASLGFFQLLNNI